MNKKFITAKSITILLIIFLIVTTPAEKLNSAQSNQIGIAAIVINLVSGFVDNKNLMLIGNDDVYENQILMTDTDSKAQLLFLDQTIMTIGAESKITLDNFIYNPNSKDKVIVNVSRGLLQFVSGSLPSERYVINTPTAIIGVRGTTLDVFVAKSGGTEVVLRKGAALIKMKPKKLKNKHKLDNQKVRLLTVPNTTTKIYTGIKPPSNPKPESPEQHEFYKQLTSLDAQNEGVFKPFNDIRREYEKKFKDNAELEIKKYEKPFQKINEQRDTKIHNLNMIYLLEEDIERKLEYEGIINKQIELCKTECEKLKEKKKTIKSAKTNVLNKVKIIADQLLSMGINISSINKRNINSKIKNVLNDSKSKHISETISPREASKSSASNKNYHLQHNENRKKNHSIKSSRSRSNIKNKIIIRERINRPKIDVRNVIRQKNNVTKGTIKENRIRNHNRNLNR